MVELKYYIFFLGTGFALLLAVGAAVSKKIAKWAFAGFLLSTMYMVDINFMSHEWYKGSTRGFEFSSSDLLLMVLMGSVLMRYLMNTKNEIRWQWLPTGSIPFLIFIGIAALSLTKAQQPLYGLFELSKLVKGYFIFWAIANLAQGADFRWVAFRVICLMAFMEIAYGALQHFSGRYRIPGTLGHPNSYAMYLNMLLPILLAGALRIRNWKPQLLLLLVVGGGTGAVILTFSRGGWMALGVAFIAVFLLTLRQEFSTRSLVIAGLACLLLIGIVVKALPRMLERWNEAPEQSLYSRLQMNQAGYLMVSQSPWLGVGINNSAAWFAVKEKNLPEGNLQGPKLFNQLLGSLQLSKEKLEKEVAPLLYATNGALIHNIYLVTAAETGLVGLVAYLLMGCRFLMISGCLAFQRQPGELNVWTIGIFAGMLAVFFQGVAEWEIRQTPIFYLFSSLLGLLAGSGLAVQNAKTLSEGVGASLQRQQTEMGYA